MTDRNTTPANVWIALRRLLNCNKTQLAERLGVNPRTLHRWEHGEDSADAHRKAAQLMQSTLRAANADAHAQGRMDFDALEKIDGRR